MEAQDNSAFVFDGSWKEYAPIAFTNLLLTIVTLGIYRFWGTTRTRRYLWSRTRFIDDRLEWTGTGKELFLGFLMVAAILGLPFVILQMATPALIMRGHGGVAGLLFVLSFAAVFYFIGVARFRALRYRLSRTLWHGIRGGSDDGGLKYGLSYIWKNLAGALPLYLATPRAMMSLWNERWNKMSFGPHDFQSQGDWHDTFKRFLLIYLVPIIAAIVGSLVVSQLRHLFVLGASDGHGNVALMKIYVIMTFVSAIGLYLLMGMAMVAFYAKFFRVGVGGLSLSTLEFQFSAKTWDWIRLFLGDIVLVICTLGIGYIFLQYRHWKFFITHMEAYGEIDLNDLTQSKTKVSKHGEGLLDALDVGAF